MSKSEKSKLIQKEYKKANKEKIKEQMRLYREFNKEKIKEQTKAYSKKNKDKLVLYNKNRKEETSLAQKKYYNLNKHKKIEYMRKYSKKRKLNDPLYRLKVNLRSRVSNLLKKNGFIKSCRTTEILGCSFVEFKSYLENKFEIWMSWDNYGNIKDEIISPNKTWDIDHIIPLSKATCEAEMLKLSHYTNLQPLCSFVNRFIKKDII